VFYRKRALWGLEVCCATEIIRVEPISTYLERWKAPTSVVVRQGVIFYVSGLPPFDPDSGEVVDASIEGKTELVLEQLKPPVETAGSSLAKPSHKALSKNPRSCSIFFRDYRPTSS
jgi:enamine deaminase RidA (YjgF/YER057c/UK114 family)